MSKAIQVSTTAVLTGGETWGMPTFVLHRCVIICDDGSVYQKEDEYGPTWKSEGPWEKLNGPWESSKQAESDLLAALEAAISLYGTPGGPWNVPSDPGGWLEQARAAVAKAKSAA